MARHVWFISIERGDFLYNQQSCLTCRVVQPMQTGRFARLSRSAGNSVEDLARTTFPTIHEVYAERLAIEAKVAAGGEGISATTRQELMLEPFELARPHFAEGYGHEGRRILRLALRPLWPTEPEIRSCLQRYRERRNRMGALLHTADVMASIYPESVKTVPGAFDY